MATLTRLASTLTAKYFPSQTLTDAFYIDGRLFGKREARQADITIDKEERGFFFSVFAHPTIPEYEIGTLPPYEPQLRGTCNEVKFGRKEIDGMIEGFLATAVDVTGKMKLNDNNDRAPYFAGVIVRDAEAFAVTIGTGLAFLYRDDTLFPLTDAGIPMEPIDSMGNRVGDFMYYCSSKTANALWSNFFTLSPDDCIILCNKEIYDALGQREILRILAEAEDQCDAAGVIITQASARMPNVPMQFSISFVESVTNEDKKGLFGFRKKNKEEDMSSMSIESTTEGGVVGAASAAIADAGFTSGLNAAAEAGAAAGAAASAAIMFGDKIPSPVAPSENQVASADKGIELDKDAPVSADSPIEFLDTSVSTEPAVEVSAEEALKNLFEDSLKKEEKEEKEPEIIEESPFVAGGFNPFDADSSASSDAATPMETVSSTPVILPDDDADKTKPIEKLDTDFLKTLEKADNNSTIKTEDIIQAALKELNEGNEVKSEVEEDKKPVSGSDEIVFSQGNEAITFDSNETEDKASAAFDPYGVGDSSEMQNAVPLVFGDDGETKAPTEEELKSDGSDGIPVPEFEIETPKPELKEDDKLTLDFPETSKADEEKKEEEEKKDEEKPSSGFELPFENPVETFSDEPKTPEEDSDIPDMPVFDGNTFDTPVNAVSSEQPINAQTEDVISYGQYVENENMAAPEPEFTAPVAESYETPDQTPPYQSFGNEGEGYAQYDNGYQYQPGQYQSYDDNAGYDPAAAAAPAPEQQAPAADNDWINAILGIDDEEDYASAAAASYEQPAAAPVAAAAATAATASAAAPTQRRPGGAPGPRPQGQRPAGPAKKPAQPASGMGGGKGPFGGKKFPKLNRNGYMFLAFVAICLIVFIFLISAIVRSCGKKEGGDETEETTTTAVEETTTALPVETTAPAADPNGPIGIFQFSNVYTGYRTWYDLFYQVYGIEIENESDPRIERIILYNGLDPATYPNPATAQFEDGELWLFLPPAEMLDPNVELVPYIVDGVPGGGAASTPAETPAETAAETAEDTAAAEN